MANNTSFEPIAIIGTACEFAGGIHTPTDLWHVLEESRDLGSEIPIERTDFISYCGHILNQDNGELRRSLIRRGYFLPTSVLDTFDASYFNISDGEAAAIDPCHRLLMLKFVHLIDDAGYTLEKMRGSRTSVYIGQFSNDHAITLLRQKPEYQTRCPCPYALLYNASARLSYHFDLCGSNLSLDTACSSSLQAIHLGVQTLRTGEADMAVCGGVNTVATPEHLLNFSTLGAVSVDGRSRSFSIDANGYAKGEGVGLVLLKRLRDAERDGDKIYCVLHDVLSNHDGREDKKAYFVPTVTGQERLLNEIYARTQYDPNRIFYAETHGTGTQVGDPIEANTIGRFFQRSPFDPPLLIGSVKSNIGHTEGASGIASLIRVAMSMKHRRILPNMHFKGLNPNIEAQRFNMHVVQTIVPFPPFDSNNENEAAVAICINSFGIGGNNAHAIVEEYRPKQASIIKNVRTCREGLQQYFLFLFSTKSSESLQKQVTSFNSWLLQITPSDDEQSFLAHLSQQCLLRRTISYKHLAIFISANLAQLRQQLDSFLSQKSSPGLVITKRLLSNNPRICFVFSGQGPQWWAMGRELYSCEPVFRRWIQLINEEFMKITNGELNLSSEMIEKTEEDSRINDTNISQPALFSIQVALAALLISWHIFPSAIVSHSAGEQAAAFVAGRLTLQEAVCLVYHRSCLQHRNTRQGGRMLAVAMSEQEACDLLLQGIEHLVCVAVVNSPRSVTLSGDEKVIDEIETILSTFHPKTFKARLRIENAFHSCQMDRFNIKEDMLSALKHIRGLPLRDIQLIFDINSAHVPFYSCVTGCQIDDNMPLDAEYWWSNIRQCVRFKDAIESIISDKIVDTFVELSPHPVLAASIRECYEKTTSIHPPILPTLTRKEDEQITLLKTMVQLSYSTDIWKHYLASRSVQVTGDMQYLFDTFPLYAFNLTPCWYESKESVIQRRAYRIPVHPLLGVRQWSDHTSATWKNLININLSEHAYLAQHKIQDTIIFPATAFIEMALTAYRQLLPTATTDGIPIPIAFKNVEFIKALILTKHQHTEVITQIVMPINEWFIYSRPWPSDTQDFFRRSGMASDDFLTSFVDQQVLNTYSLRQFTLHARGHIELGPHLNVYASSALQLSNQIKDCRYSDAADAYAYMSTRGYHYGPKFMRTKWIKSAKSKVIGCIFPENDEQNDDSYYLHPLTIDSCFHGGISILPGVETILPAAIGRLIVYGSTFHVPQLISHIACHSTLAGMPKEHAYTFDGAIFDARDDMASSNTKPIVMCEMFKLQQISHDRSPLNKSLFEKVNQLVSLPNSYVTEHIHTIMADYCLQKKWLPCLINLINTADLLPSTNILINKIGQIDQIKNDSDDIDIQLTDSIDSLNVLAANYALYALQHLSSLRNTHLIIEDELRNHIRKDKPYFVWFFEAIFSLVRHHGLIDASGNPSLLVTNHSLQLMRKRILDQFPSLKSIFVLLNVNGLRLGSILSGMQTIDDLFMNDKDNKLILADVLSTISSSKTRYIFQVFTDHLCASHPKYLRVLIVGSDTSAIALPILQQLIIFAEHTDTYVKLLYVDLTETILSEAKEAFETIFSQDQRKSQRVSVSYHVYDMEAEFDKTNILYEVHDIVFAAYVLQTTNDVMHSINSLRRLLVPGGFLVLLELTISHSYFDLLFGIFPYWWRDRHSRAPLTLDKWTQVIQSAHGFDTPTVSSKQNQFGDTLIIARKSTSRPTLIQLPEWQDQAWLILANRTQSTENLLDTLVSHLPSSNIMLLQYVISTDDICLKIKTMLSQYRQLYIVFAWPLESISLGQCNDETTFKKQEELCNILVCILQTVQQCYQMDGSASFSFPYVFVLTQNYQSIDSNQSSNLSVAPIIGLARSLSIEYANHHIKLIDLQTTASMFSDSSFSSILIQHLINCRTADDLDEIVLCLTENGCMQRYEWHYDFFLSKKHNDVSMIQEHVIIPQKDPEMNPFQLQIAPSRLIADLNWTRESLPTNCLLPGQALIRIHCVGLNFRTVLKARGLYPHTRNFAESEKDQPFYNRDSSLGEDYVGSIVHSNSNHLKVGDRVIGIHTSGTFRSHAIVDDHRVLRISEECLMSDEELSTLIIAFLTAIISLKDCSRLKSDQIVLIHAATGATGQACIQYSQAIGARVIATAGTEEKRRFVREHYGIEHVFNSRDLSFVKEVRSLFPNGVNVIINSLSGPFLQESLKLLAPHGHFVELGKKDVYEKSNLSMFELRENCSFHVIDLVSKQRDEPNYTRESLRDIIDYCRAGIFKPIEPLNIFEPSEVIDAFTQCSLGKSMGKIVVRITTSDKPLLVKKNNSEMRSSENEKEETMFPSIVCDNGTILISGGLGGLGLTMSRWMIEKRGVKRIILMSRRTLTQFEEVDNNPQLDDWIRLKEAETKYGASIDVVQIDVTQLNNVCELMQRLNKTSHPIRGIIHSAVISDDKLLTNLNQETLVRVIEPKVHGGWNLHQASQLVQAPLHFFVMFSSIRNHLINPGSSAYNAGNEFLEALAQYRYEKLRLPALTISLPAISGAGMFHRQKDLLTSLYSSLGLEMLPTEGTFEIVERLFTTQTYCSSPIIFSANWQTLNHHKDHLPNCQLVELIEKQANWNGLSQISRNSSNHIAEITFETILERIQVTVMRLLGMASIDRIDISRSLLLQGMDSITGSSLYNWLLQEWDVHTTLADIFQGISVQEIAKQVHRTLIDRYKVETKSETAASIDTKMPEMTEEISEVSTTNKILSYNGMERIVTILPVKDSRSNIFYISHRNIVVTESLKKLASDKSNVYVIHAPSNQFDMKTCVCETIGQIRRLQPRGPYSLLPIDNDSKHFVDAIVKQLKQHYIQADINHDY